MAFLRAVARVALFTVLAFALAAAFAQPAPPRVQGPVDDAQRVPLPGTPHAAFQAAPNAVSKPLDDSAPAGRMILLLRRSDVQQAALDDFLQAAHTPGDPHFRQWLNPAEFGRLYGPAESDLAAVTAWLQAQGLEVSRVPSGRAAIEFTGTAAQVRQAFHAGLRTVAAPGGTRLAFDQAPSVPAALAPVIAGVTATGSQQPQPLLRVAGRALFDPATHQTTPQWTYPNGSSVSYVVAPADFAVQYNMASVYRAGITGAGQSIAIVSASNVDLSLVQAYQTLFGLGSNLPQVVVDGADPGQNQAATEAYLDLELAGAVAPGAKVLLYTSGGTALPNGLVLAAYRAVEDDQAGILSVSYGECEAQLGQTGNALWAALWQQAAAQGQTVFVAAGDAGSAGCDNFDAQTAAYGGLAVNGIASTPYNVAVGGTDFYYSQSTGTAGQISTQLASYWSASSTAPAASLKQPAPEQAWNDYFGINLIDGGTPANLTSQNIVAGGGGPSSAALYSNTGAASGYAKPAWQTGTGVPADKLRDLPDLSLFAANGSNLSFYPICASPGDCSSTNLAQGGAVVVTGVGGTSASAPAMAGIQALVNQSTGAWAGQANYIYYPLAAQQPSAFRDVATGGNQVLCYAGTANCVQGKSGTTLSGYTVESGYPAAAGYDLATGLGTVDVANLIKYWNAVSRIATTTTLNINPSALAHGKTATVTGAVTAASGSGTPTGAIALLGFDGLPHSAGLGSYPLIAGTLYTSVDNLPGGTYQLTAAYSGDASYAPSKSAPVTVTITPESNTLNFTGWVWNPFDLFLYPLSSGVTVPYGAELFLDAQPVSANATLSGQPTPATGAVTFTDKLASATTTAAQPLNVQGTAEWSSGVFAPGSHTVSAAYAGDASYSASTSASAAFTVVPGSTSLTVTPLATTVAAGGSVTVDLQLATGYLPLYGKAPTGNVTVKLGSLTQTATWQAWGTTGNASLEASVTFTGVPSGLLPVTASYAGDTNWLASAANGGAVLALSSRLAPTVALTATAAAPTPGQSTVLTAKVTGPSGKATPTGTVAFVCDGLSFNSIATLAAGTASLTVPANSLANGVNVFTAIYQGDGAYTTGTSSALNITVAKPDFSLTALTSQLPIAPATSGSVTLALAPINGFSGAVTLTASAPSGITVTPATASPSVSAALTDVLTLAVSSAVVPGVYPVVITATGGGHVHTAQILVAVLAVAPPVFSPAAGTYPAAQQVTLSDAVAGAAIYYTVNGTAPTTASTRYTGAIAISATATVQAIAVAPGYPASAVASATFTITPLAATPAFSPAAGTYSNTQSVTIASTTAGATFYYTTNGTAPSTSSTKYTAAVKVTTSETLTAIATAAGYSTSAVASAAYTLQAATPTFTPAAGSYTSAQSVKITSATTGATIYYTTNGSAPTTSSTKYTAAVKVSATTTLNAIAVATGFTNSATGTAAYTINLPAAATPSFSPAPGTYTSAQNVAISCTTSGATLYYTTNGSAPTASSTKYTGAIKITASTTLKVIAVATGYSNSAVATAAYVISSTVRRVPGSSL